jgi:hypothetical protein
VTLEEEPVRRRLAVMAAAADVALMLPGPGAQGQTTTPTTTASGPEDALDKLFG